MTQGSVGEPARHYHPVGIFFHWLMATMVFVQLWWGWRTTALVAGYERADAYVVHAQLGAAILVVAGLRLGWRLIAPFIAPKLEKPEDMPGWQHLSAQLTHWGLYALMIALPVTGLLMIGSTAPQTLERAIGLPGFQSMSVTERAQLEHLMERLHFVCVWGMVGLLIMHIGAALAHHFVRRDDVLARMIPWLGRERADADTVTTRNTHAAKTTR